MTVQERRALEEQLAKHLKKERALVARALKVHAAKMRRPTPPCPNNPKDACKAMSEWMWDMYYWSLAVHYTLWPNGPDGPTPPPKPPFK